MWQIVSKMERSYPKTVKGDISKSLSTINFDVNVDKNQASNQNQTHIVDLIQTNCLGGLGVLLGQSSNEKKFIKVDDI